MDLQRGFNTVNGEDTISRKQTTDQYNTNTSSESKTVKSIFFSSAVYSINNETQEEISSEDQVSQSRSPKLHHEAMQENDTNSTDVYNIYEYIDFNQSDEDGAEKFFAALPENDEEPHHTILAIPRQMLDYVDRCKNTRVTTFRSQAKTAAYENSYESLTSSEFPDLELLDTRHC